jgi:myosin heavy subunit
MEDINQLVMSVKSDGITQATTNLTQLTKAAVDAEAAVNYFGDEFKKIAPVAQANTTATQQSSAVTDALAKCMQDAASASTKAAQSIDALIAKMNQLTPATGAVEEATKRTTAAHGSMAAMTRETLVLAHEAAIGSTKRFAGSLMVLLNQSGALGTAMTALKDTLGSALLPVGALVGAVALLGGTVLAESAHFKTINDQITLTGDASALTAQQILHDSETMSVAGKNSSGSIKAIMEGLATSGEFTKEQIEGSADALATYSRMSGKTSEEVVKQFSGMKDGVKNWALEIDKTMPIFDGAAIDTINMMEKMGNHTEAASYAMKLFTEYMQKNGTELTNWQKIVKEASDDFNAFLGGIMRLVNGPTHQQQLDDAKAVLAQSKNLSAETQRNMQLKVQQAQASVDADNKAAQAQSKATEKVKEAAMAVSALGSEIKKVKDKPDKFADESKRISELFDKANTATVEGYTKEQVLKMAEEKWNKDHQKRGEDDSLQHRNNLKAIAQDEFNDRMEEDQAIISHSLKTAEKNASNQKDELTQRQKAYADEVTAIKAYYATLIAADNAYLATKGHSKSQQEAGVTNRQRDINAEGKAIAAVNQKRADDEDNIANKINAYNDKEIKDITSKGDAEDKRLQKEIDGLNQKAQISKSMQILEKANQEEDHLMELIGIKQSIEAKLEQAKVSDDYNDDQIKALQDAYDQSSKNIDLQNQAIVLLKQQADAQKELDRQADMTKTIDENLAAAKRFEQGMNSAFGAIGKSLGQVGVAFTQMAKNQDTAHQQFMRNLKEAGNDEEAQQKARMQYEQDFENASITGFADIAQGMQGMFDVGSTGYQALGAISKVFHAIEMAQYLERIGKAAIEAVLNQANGDPYTAFGRMAAMAAIVAGLGVAVSASGGGGSSGTSAADVQKAQGTGTVFGDSSAKSDAITKTFDNLKSNSDIMIPLTQAMQASLAHIESAMTGLTNLVVRNGNIATGQGLGIQTGTIQRGAEGFMGSVLSGVSKVLNVIPIVGGLMGTIVDKIGSLWGSTKQSITDAGLMFSGSVKALQSGQGFQQYANVQTTQSSWFGLSKSTSNSIQAQGIDQTLADQFGLVFKGLEDAMKTAAPALGKSANDVGKAIENMVLDTQKVSLQGLTGQALETAINNVMSEAMDKMAQTAFPGFEAFQQVGEGYSQTVMRVATDTADADAALKKLGVTAISFNDIADKSGDVAAQIVQQSIVLQEAGSGVGRIIEGMTASAKDLATEYADLYAARRQMEDMGLGGGLNISTLEGAGDLKTLQSGLSTYYDKFFNQSEKNQQQIDDMTESFKKLGFTLPDSEATLRRMIESAAEMGDQKTVGALLALTDGFSKLAESMGNAGKVVSQAAEAFSKLQDAVASQKTAVDNAYQAQSDALANQHYAIMDNIDANASAIEEAQMKQMASMSAYINQLTAQEAATQASITAMKTQVSVLNSIVSASQSAAQAVTAESLADIRRNAMATLQTASTAPDLSAVPGLLDAIKDIQKPAETLYSSLYEFTRDQGIANNNLNTINQNGTTQVTAAQAQLDALNKLDTDLKNQIDAMNKSLSDAVASGTDAVQKAKDAENTRYQAEQAKLDAQHTDQIARLDLQVKTAQDQLNAINVVNTSVLSVSAAIAGFNASINATVNSAIAAAGAASPTGRSGSTSPVSFSVYNAANTLTNSLGRDAGGGPLPTYAMGTNELPKDQIAMVHKGERIVPAADNAELMRRLKTPPAQSADTQQMNAKMNQLIQTMVSGDTANYQITREMFKYIRNWNSEGMPPTRPNL